MTDPVQSQPFDLSLFVRQMNPHVAVASAPGACAACCILNKLQGRKETVLLWLEPSSVGVMVHIEATILPDAGQPYDRKVFVPIGANWGPLAQEFLHDQTVATIASLIAGWEDKYQGPAAPAPASTVMTASLGRYDAADQVQLRRLLTKALPHLTGEATGDDLDLLVAIDMFMQRQMPLELKWLLMTLTAASGIDLTAMPGAEKEFAEAAAGIRALLSVH